MFAKPIQTADPRLLVKIVTGDAELGRRLKAALEPAGRFHIELLLGRLGDMAAKFEPVARASLLIVEIDQQSTDDLAALESVLRGAQLPPATVVVSDGLAASAARRLLKLQIADWLPKSCSDRELLLACEQALKPADSGTSQHARCTTFVSALGGAGATTLSMAAASVLAGKARAGLAGCCIVDLNFQSGAACDYLDVGPTLQLSEIAATPARLDDHLLEVMLTRHASELAILAAPPSLTGFETIGADLVGRLLDLASLRFENVIIDLPRLWLPWCENVMRGTDALYIVTELTVTGLRQARRLADTLETSCGINTKDSVIVNKVPWLGSGSVKKANARDVLGDRLCGFVSDAASLVREAQNRGLLLSQVKKRNRIEADLKPLLLKG